MATRAHRRAKRMRARQHTREQGKPHTKRVFYDKKTGARLKSIRGISTHLLERDFDAVDIPAGRQSSPSGHKADPLKHGERLDARGMIDKALAELGFIDPTDATRQEFSRLARDTGSIGLAKQQLQRSIDKASREAFAKSKRGSKGKEVKLETTPPVLIHPGEEMWEDILAEAKRRKKSVGKMALKRGLKPVSDTANPKDRESWVTA